MKYFNKSYKQYLPIALFLFFVLKVSSQTPSEQSCVFFYTTIDENVPGITIHWENTVEAEGHTIWRKRKNESTWDDPVAVIAAPANSFFDEFDEVEHLRDHYEYKIQREGGPTAYSYHSTGHALDAVHYRGGIILVIDETVAAALDIELEILKEDLVGDGWEVFSFLVNPNAAPNSVKGQITTIYSQENNVTAVYLIGKIPVPYSGNFAPDGQNADHKGAWPSDGYYANIQENWTDVIVNNSASAANSTLQNTPFDGKFDPTFFPSNVILQIGRVDFSNLPIFAEDETTLLRNYLTKAHEYKHGIIGNADQALIDDEFQNTTKKYASNGFRNFNALVGENNIDQIDYANLISDSYKWSYGCGTGTFDAAAGVVTANDFAQNDYKTTFTMLYGEYFGDWNTQNNLLRAALGSGTILTSCWAGNPNWFLNHMGMGETIGESTRTTMNSSFYGYSPGGGYPRGVHIALMGDPTLRSDIVSPPGVLFSSLQAAEGRVQLTWDAPTGGDYLGFNIYRSLEEFTGYNQINESIVTDFIYYDEDIDIDDELYYYMVKTVKMEEKGYGSYENMSQGVFNKIILPLELLSFNVETTIARSAILDWYTANEEDFSHFEIERKAGNGNWFFLDKVQGTGQNQSLTHYSFEDKFPEYGINYYRLKMVDTNGSSRYSPIESVTFDKIRFNIFPNPTVEQISFVFEGVAGTKAAYQIYDSNGQLVFEKEIPELMHSLQLETLDICKFTPGVYMLSVKSRYWQGAASFVKQEI